MKWEVRLAASAERDMRRLSLEVRRRVDAAILQLEDGPSPTGRRKLSGGEGLYRVRVGDYRILYGIDTEGHFVDIVHVRHRREAYRR